MFWSTFTALSLVTAGYALPRTPYAVALSARQDDPDVCKHERTDPNAMKDSGADQYFSDFLTRDDNLAWSKQNWLRSLDEFSTKTKDGGAYHSTLDCTTLEDRAHCLIPDQGVECRWFTPPEVYWVRLWAPNVQTFFDSARNKLIDDAIKQSLSADSLGDDFNVGSLDSNSDLGLVSAIAWVVAPGLGFAASVTSMVAKSGKKLEGALLFGNFAADSTAAGTNLGSVLAGRGSQPLTPADLSKIMQNLYVEFFGTRGDYIRKLNKQFYTGLVGEDGEENLVGPFMDTLKGLDVGMNTNLHPVAAILGSGLFSSGASNEALENALDEGFKVAKAQMIGAILAAQGIALFGDKDTSADACKDGGRGRLDGDVCLSFFKVGCRGVFLVADDFDNSVLDRLDKYSVNMEDMMKSIKECNNRFNEELSGGDNLFNNGYPRCWFAMPYFEAEGSPGCADPPPPGFNYQKCVVDKGGIGAGGGAGGGHGVPDPKR